MFSLIPWKRNESVQRFRGGDHAQALAPFDAFRSDFERIFDRFFQTWPSPWEGLDAGWGVDLHEKDNALTVRIEAPGFEIEDFELRLSGNVLQVRAEHKSETRKQDDSHYSCSHSKIERSIPLPVGAKFDQAEAKYRNGVLTVTIPKGPEAKARRIPVKT